jgi:pullulanase
VKTFVKSAFGLRRSVAFIALLSIFAVLLPAQAFATPSTVHLTIHYQRPGEDYKGWNLWLWKNVSGSSGDVDVNANGTEFNGDDAFGKVLKIDIADMQNFESVGFIVRLGAWVSKDVGDDRFVTTFDSNGNAEIWLIQGDKTIYTTAPTATATMRSASIDGFRTISVELSKKMTLTGSGNEGFTISDGLNVSSVTALNGTSTSASQVQLNLDSDVALGKTYTISHATYGKIETTPGKIMNSEGFNTRFTYTGNDLGNTYFADHTDFRVWAPTATAVKLVTYAKADTPSADGVVSAMTADQNGTWIATQKVNANGLIYNYRVTVGGVEREAVDPYVRATTINGERGVVVDLSKTDPSGWNNKKPAFSGKGTDALIYELHVRDLSMDASGNFPVAQKGKYSALTNMKAKTNSGGPAGVAAIKDLGATHVELQPIFDFASVDEASPSFNWGYDPQNYNVPEGSYSSDPRNPTARITELKGAIQSLHDNGLRVMMDVVYNHVFAVSSFSEEKIVPGYFFRTNSDGSLANGSGVGNDVASERPMVRKFIVDSVKYWASQYHLDGFRFDLMGLIDITTMQQIRKELTKIDPTILIIGEAWDMGTLTSAEKSNQANLGSLPGIAAFNDQIRDGIKGSVFNATETGYATGTPAQINNTKVGIIGNVFYSREVLGRWITTDPTQSVNYVESHDNLTLFDKLTASVPNATPAKLETLDRFASSIAFLAQGVPFMQAGQEFLRSKGGDSNSYRSSDAVNSLKWDLRTKNISTVNYYKGLFALRKAHPAFRMSTTPAVQKNLVFLKTSNDIIAYSLNGSALKDSWKTIVVVHNPNATAQKITLPSKGEWKIVVNETNAGVKVLKTIKATTGIITVAPLATTVLTRN